MEIVSYIHWMIFLGQLQGTMVFPINDGGWRLLTGLVPATWNFSHRKLLESWHPSQNYAIICMYVYIYIHSVCVCMYIQYIYIYSIYICIYATRYTEESTAASASNSDLSGIAGSMRIAGPPPVPHQAPFSAKELRIYIYIYIQTIDDIQKYTSYL